MKLSKVRSGFTLLPEGQQILQLVEIEDKSQFEKMNIKFKNEHGLTTTSKFSIDRDKSFQVFSEIIRYALNDFETDELDIADAEGKYILADVTHSVVDSNKEDGRTFTFVNVYPRGASDGWGKQFVDVDEDDDDIFGED